MAQINQGGIQFNQVKTVGISLDQWPIHLSGQTGSDEDGGVVNAVDIDWNGAVLPNGNHETGSSSTINTTGDLLKLIDKMNEEIYTLAAAVIAIGTKVS